MYALFIAHDKKIQKKLIAYKIHKNSENFQIIQIAAIG